jgi:DNA-binding transcriptional ArsR family regulator
MEVRSMGAKRGSSKSKGEKVRLKSVPSTYQIYEVLSDPLMARMLKIAYSGVKGDFSNVVGKLTKRQYLSRLRQLKDIGLVEKQRDNMYRTTSLGALVYKSNFRTLEKILDGFWHLQAVDVLKGRTDLPGTERDILIKELLEVSELNQITNDTHLSGFTIVRDFESLIVEVLRVLDNAKKEIYFASRYHDPHISSLAIKKFTSGVRLHIIDGNPKQTSFDSRINAILRTAPDKETYNQVVNMVRSPRFELLRLEKLPTSFIVVDERQVVYETVSYVNPHEFTIAIANYDDSYLAEKYITYFHLLKQNAQSPMFIEEAARASSR